MNKPLLPCLPRLLCLGAVLLCLGAPPAHAGPVPWTDAPYRHFADRKPLAQVLAEFASSFSLGLDIAPGVEGAVNGRFTAASPTEFITRLAGVYGFAWYTHAGMLHVSPASDFQSRSIVAPSGNLTGLRQALTDLGLLEPRFGWGELPQQGVVLVSGPPSYVERIAATVRDLPASGGAQQVAVFRLKNASAQDRTILYRDREITTPGLASVLRELITGRGGGMAGSESLSAIAAPLRSAQSTLGDSTGAQPSAATGPSEPPAQRTVQTDAANSAGGRTRAPSVQADARLNAIIVQDVPERMPIYRALIEQLDMPTALIEIEAMIIDVNTERAKDLGIDWSRRVGSTAVGFGNLSSTPSAGTLSVVRGPSDAVFTSSSLSVTASNFLISQIRLLESKGDAQIQSRPSVVTVDNIGALLDLSETFYIRVQGERVATVTPVTAGTTLRVTPRVVGESAQDSLVQLVIDIEDGQIQDREIDSLPTVRRSAVSTQAIVRPQEALLIAGYSSDQQINSRQGVPILGDVPGLGLLFSTRTQTVQRRERLFLIRPTIVSLPGQAPLATPVPAVPSEVSPRPAAESPPPPDRETYSPN